MTIPSSVTSIEDGVFRGCGGLASVTIPEGVTSIGDGAFENCKKLATLTFEGKPPQELKGAKIGQRVRIRYPAKYESEWLSALKDCKLSKREAVQ